MSLLYGLPSPPTIKGQANDIASWIDTSFAKDRKGVVKVIQSPRHLWEEIFLQDDQPRVFVMFAGERSRGPSDQMRTLHRVDRSWTVVIMRGHGWANLMPNADEGTEEDFLTTIEVLRDKIRVLLSVSEEFPLEYVSMDALPNMAPTKEANAFMDAYQIKFTTANDIPAITLTAP